MQEKREKMEGEYKLLQVSSWAKHRFSLCFYFFNATMTKKMVSTLIMYRAYELIIAVYLSNKELDCLFDPS